MDETFMLILLVIVMLIGSYLAGSIPLVVSMSEQKLKIITIFGAGLLVGTALTVIIPEGIRALYSELLHQPNESGGHQHQHQQQQQQQPVSAVASPHLILQNTVNPTITNFRGDQSKISSIEHQATEYSSTIGISLVLGFVFMMLVDQISSRRRSSSANGSSDIVHHSDKNSTATIGLVVHAAADGIALGAAATTSHQDVEMIVFLAIMLHKAPAAFGLVTFLLHEGIDHQRIRKHLAIFSMSAPLFALLTYFGIGQEQKETLNSLNATGIAMLFSGGTFLYVATVHVLPELTSNQHHQHQHHHSNNYHRHHYNKSSKYNHLHDEDQDDLLLMQQQQQQQHQQSNDITDDRINSTAIGSGTGTGTASSSSAATTTTSIVMHQPLNNNGGPSSSSSSINTIHNSKGYTELKNIELAILITGALLPLLLTMGHHH